ncbi:hypothetical protein AAG906_029099 [Vitis piasezkii]
MFKDIGKRPSVAEMIRNARKITNFIYNHGWLLVEMRKYCGGEIVRLGATRLNLHSFIIAYFLNPRFQYKRGVRSDPDLIQVVHDVFAKLDSNAESIGQFGNELVLFRDAKRGFGDQATVASRSTIVPKVHSESFNKDTKDSFQGVLNSHQEVHSISVGQSSRPSAASTSASGYDGSKGGTDDGSDNARGDIGERQQSQYPMSQFTSKMISRIAHKMKTMALEELVQGVLNMSIETQLSDSSNEANVYSPYVMGYGQPSSSSDEEYGMLSYLSVAQMSYQVPYQM